CGLRPRSARRGDLPRYHRGRARRLGGRKTSRPRRFATARRFRERRDPMTEPFQPTLLVSMPQLQDPNFTRAVVLLCDYVPDGAFGLVLNRPTDLPASTMVKLE